MYRFQFNRRQTSGSLLVPSVLLTFVLLSLALSLQATNAHAKSLAASQVYNSDLTVRSGEVVEGDVLITSGDATVENGGIVQGSLVVLSGDVHVEEGGQVAGDVTAFSGSVDIGGTVNGSVAAVSGDISLGQAAAINGDVSVVSGEISRAKGASVIGSVVRGPNIKLPTLPSFPGFSSLPSLPGSNESEMQVPPVDIQVNNGPGFFRGLFGFIGRLLAAALLSAMVALLVSAVYRVRSGLVHNWRNTLLDQPALVAITGLLLNVAGIFLITLFSITICLIPVALVLGLALLAINLLGWSALAHWVGERVLRYTKSQAQPLAQVAVGAIVLTGSIALLWALGWCFRPLAGLAFFAATAFGAGAVVLPWIRKFSAGKLSMRDLRGAVSEVTSGLSEAAATVTGTVTNTVTNPATTPATTPVAPDAVAPATSGPIVIIPGEAGLSSTPTASETASAAMPGEAVPAETAWLEAVQEAAPLIPAATLQPSAATSEVTFGEDDFTLIDSIGPIFARRLQAANVRTFAQLASMETEAIAAIIGWLPATVVSEQLIEQAHQLAVERGEL